MFCRLFPCREFGSRHSQKMRGIYRKRKFAEVENYPCYSSSSSSPSSLSSPASSEWESDGEGSSSENQDFTPHSPASPSRLPSKFPSLSLFSNNADLFSLSARSLIKCFIGVSLIRLKQKLERTGMKMLVLDDPQRMTPPPVSVWLL